MKPKISGACTKCDLEVFEVVERDEQRLPIKLGLPLDDAVRITFRLFGGSRWTSPSAATAPKASTRSTIRTSGIA
jgi:hypothetical protein